MTSNLSDTDTAAVQKAAVQNMYDGFSKHIVQRDIDALLRYYTDDAIAMPPHHPSATGPAAIRAWLEAMPKMTRIDFVVDEIAGSGDLAMVRGTYSMSLSVAGVPQGVDDRGESIRKRQPDGSWPMWRDIFNSDLPKL